MKAKKLLVSVFIALLFASCSKDDDVNNPGTSDSQFIFWEKGNEWIYTGNVAFDNGKYSFTSYESRVFISSVYENSSALVHKITHYKHFEGTQNVGLRTYLDKQLWDVKDDYWAITEEGDIFHSSIYSPPFPIFFNNNTVGKKWVATYCEGTPIAPLETRTRKILSVSETVEVPAGIFKNCVKVKEISDKDPEYYYIYWGTPKDGIVKYEKRWFYYVPYYMPGYPPLLETYAIVRAELFSKNF